MPLRGAVARARHDRPPPRAPAPVAAAGRVRGRRRPARATATAPCATRRSSTRRSTSCSAAGRPTSRSSRVPTEEHLPVALRARGAPACTCWSRSRSRPPSRRREQIIAAVRARRRARAPSATSSASTRRCSRCASACWTGSSATSSSIATERIGPFPDRVRDVGVVKDLATHDLDLVRWLGDAPIADASPRRPQHRMGRAHEDLVLVTGRLATGVAVQLDRRLADADEDAPHARARRPRHARRRHADRRPDLLRERQRRPPSGPARRRCAASPRAT